MSSKFIKNIKPITYNQYMNISSNEKLAIFAVKYLINNNIELTFANICIASFKLFPEKFYFDENFKEYPHIEKLNRTILHMVTNKSQYLVGSPRTGYEITENGLLTASQVEADIFNTHPDKAIRSKTVTDIYKKGAVQLYTKLLSDDEYRKYDIGEKIDLNFIWKFFNVIPFTQKERIKKEFNYIKEYAKEQNNNKCVSFIKIILKSSELK